MRSMVEGGRRGTIVAALGDRVVPRCLATVEFPSLDSVARRPTKVERPLPGDYSISAPSPAISPMNSGKLVTIILASSTVTGFSEASPMIRKLMAMR